MRRILFVVTAGPARPDAQLRRGRLPQEQREQGRRRVPAGPNEDRADCQRLIAQRQAAGESSGLAKDQRRRARRHAARDPIASVAATSAHISSATPMA
jgi:hypothetical protein